MSDSKNLLALFQSVNDTLFTVIICPNTKGLLTGFRQI
jgi:hypothetical protein